MASLARHYGADASVDAAAAAEIGAFLERNAGRDRGGVTTGAEPQRITTTPWFVKEHREVRAADWNVRGGEVRRQLRRVPRRRRPRQFQRALGAHPALTPRRSIMTSTPKASRILVWDLPLRLFHWLLAASFAGAFLTAESERWRDIHVMLGYTMLALVAFRVAWGVFRHPVRPLRELRVRSRRACVSYLRSLLTGAPHQYTGHNPAGSWAIFALLGCAIAAAGTGLALYNEVGGRWMEHLHEFVANAMLAVVAVHVAGVAAGSLLHRENLVRAMFTGYKAGSCRRRDRRAPPHRRGAARRGDRRALDRRRSGAGAGDGGGHDARQARRGDACLY